MRNMAVNDCHLMALKRQVQRMVEAESALHGVSSGVGAPHYLRRKGDKATGGVRTNEE
jgi:hypothetical protein